MAEQEAESLNDRLRAFGVFVLVTAFVWALLAIAAALGMLDTTAIVDWLKTDSPLKYIAEKWRNALGAAWQPAAAIAVAGALEGVRALFEGALSRHASPPFLNRVSERNADTFVSRRIPLTARDDELRKLQLFLAGSPNLQWLWLTGPGRRGKRRLAVELCIRRGRVEGAPAWKRSDAGFVKPSARKPDFVAWKPRRPTLLIVADAGSHQELVRDLLRGLAEQSEDLGHPVRVLLIDGTIPTPLESLHTDKFLATFAALGGRNAFELADFDGAHRAEFFKAVLESSRLTAGRIDGELPMWLLEAARLDDGLTAVEAALPYLEMQKGLLMPANVRNATIVDAYHRFEAESLDPRALSLCAAATIMGPLAWTEAEKLQHDAAELVRDVAAATGLKASDGVPGFGEGNVHRLLALLVLHDRPLPERHMVAALCWRSAAQRTAKFVHECASIKIWEEDKKPIPSSTYGWLVHPPPADANTNEHWLLLIYSLETYLLQDRPTWPMVLPLLTQAIATAGDGVLVQSVGLALAAAIDRGDQAVSAAEARSILRGATGASERFSSNKTSGCIAADVSASAASLLGTSAEDLEVLRSAAPSMLESTQVDLQARSWPTQGLAELRLRVLAALAQVPWPDGLDPLSEVRAIRSAFPASRRIIEAALHTVERLSSDPRTAVVEVQRERVTLSALRTQLDSLDEDLARLAADLYRNLLSRGAPPLTLEDLELMRRRHPRAQRLHECILEVLERGDGTWAADALAHQRHLVTTRIAASDFDPPDSEMTLRRWVHENRLSVLGG